MEIYLEDMRRLVDIGQQLTNQHKEFVNAASIMTIFRPRGDCVYLQITCMTVDNKWHNYRYKIETNVEEEGEGWPVKQIGYDNYVPAPK